MAIACRTHPILACAAVKGVGSSSCELKQVQRATFRRAKHVGSVARRVALLQRVACSAAAADGNALRAPTLDASASSSAANTDVKGDMLQPSALNKNWARISAIAAAVLLTSRGTGYLPSRGAAFVHMLAFATWLGTIVWTTFIGGITMFKNLPRQTFGRLQAKLFPPYFALNAACVTVLMGTLGFNTAGLLQQQLATLGVALGASLLNWLWIEPTATNVMLERYDLENAPARDAEKIKALYKEFGKWHGMSSAVNLAAVFCAVAHGWWLSKYVLLA